MDNGLNLERGEERGAEGGTFLLLHPGEKEGYISLVKRKDIYPW